MDGAIPEHLTDQVDPARPDFREINYTSFDGIELYVRDYGPADSDALPLICLHGFSRNSSDFDEIAQSLGKRRRVLVPDLRGRGHSGYARHWSAYNLANELRDLTDLLAIEALHKCIFIGTSRGGLIAMALASARPGVIAGLVLNDIGPVIETVGLLRIQGQLENPIRAVDYSDAAMLLKVANRHALPDLDDEAWLAFAKRRFMQTDKGLVLDFDPGLVKAFKAQSVKADSALPPYWLSFTALNPYPMLAIRGELSEILSAQTLEQMADRHPDIETLTVDNRGHVPLLNEPGVLKAIERLIKRAERK
jgi:pimeloyl-ACP methyl ester carboxylesterase